MEPEIIVSEKTSSTVNTCRLVAVDRVPSENGSSGDRGILESARSAVVRFREKRSSDTVNGSVNGRRERSSFSDSQAVDEISISNHQDRRSRSMSLYGAPPSCRFGPKASVVQSQDTVLTIQDPSALILSWYKPPQSVLIIKKVWDDLVDQPFVELATWLVKDRKMEVFVEKKVMEDYMIAHQPGFAQIRDELCTFEEDCHNLSGQIDMIICLGGDGTLLYASSLFQESVPPVMAFHLGSLGFLSPFEISDYKEKIDSVLQGKSTRLMLRTRLKCCLMEKSVKHDGPPTRTTILALNEVVVDRGATSYLCHLDLYIQGRLVTVVQGDGLIISTPTGSTAYSAAAGASMVHPNVPAIIIAPICPHSLSFRPIVVPAGVEVKVTVSQDARGDAWASFDGRQRQSMSKGTVLIISTSKYPMPSVCHHDPVGDWFNSLAACLHWNDRKTQLPFSPTLDPASRQMTPDQLDSSDSNCS